MIISDAPLCNKYDCFRNKCSMFCDLLTDVPSQPCPFYKTDEQADSDYLEAHNKLLAMGKKGEELIQKYEYNRQRRRQW